MAIHPIVSRSQWLQARQALLEQEKTWTREHDRLSAARLALPWVLVDKLYLFDTPQGKASLADLFGPRSQLLIYHFMFGPGWQEGCVGCSFLSDHIDAARQHLEQHDVSLVVVSRAPLAELAPFQKRMGWKFPWVSSHGSDFNFDYRVSFTPEQVAGGTADYNFGAGGFPIEEGSGTSAFYKDQAGQVFHTYSTFARGAEPLIGAYAWLDMAPLGRNEHGQRKNLTDWVRHHDRYGAGGQVAETGRYQAAQEPTLHQLGQVEA